MTHLSKISLLFFLFLFLFPKLNSQNSFPVHALMDTEEATNFSSDFPNEIETISQKNGISAVLLSDFATQTLRNSVTTHGSKYIFQPDRETALQTLEIPARRETQFEYTITEDEYVRACLDLVNTENIKETILELEGYGTRYHTTAQAEQAVLDQQAKWDNWISTTGRSDIRTRIYEHVGTPMPSLILTIDGAESPEEYIIVGGHIDSISWQENNAPGADDNASGIASINEMVRILLETGFQPKRTVEIMAYAAEEIGLVGSAEIAAEYAQNNINVLGYVQFDMTAYKGSTKDVYIAQDNYNSPALNSYLEQLMDHYNSSGDHAFTYGSTICGYGCSDHASWAANGFDASFPFESAFEESNPNIHTPEDLYSFFDTADHAAKFTKLGLEFIIESSKVESLSVPDFGEHSLVTWIREKTLFYELKNTTDEIAHISLFDISGKNLISKEISHHSGSENLQNLSAGFYIIRFKTTNNREISKKIILN